MYGMSNNTVAATFASVSVRFQLLSFHKGDKELLGAIRRGTVGAYTQYLLHLRESSQPSAAWCALSKTLSTFHYATNYLVTTTN
jgi:hypothetical protein